MYPLTDVRPGFPESGEDCGSFGKAKTIVRLLGYFRPPVYRAADKSRHRWLRNGGGRDQRVRGTLKKAAHRARAFVCGVRVRIRASHASSDADSDANTAVRRDLHRLHNRT